ncbi:MULTISPECIES: hypothetical protein [Novosphingobium]|uniref:hypothetical protein n=1 Tax=Novosphingobium TaxID=165696 RepID=UPI0022F26BE8|nr:hypothetical protein [Novosphingobium resinovorum]GLK46999.1 hypothetical protein GCM10017612_49210 [Novosphingobium resinovorum]
MFDTVVALREKGWTISAIAQETGRDRKTIRQWLMDRQPGQWERTSRHPANAFDDFIRARWADACRNATQLYREVCERGYSGSVKGFRQWVKIRIRDGIEDAAPRSSSPRPAKTDSVWTAMMIHRGRAITKACYGSQVPVQFERSP